MPTTGESVSASRGPTGSNEFMAPWSDGTMLNGSEATRGEHARQPPRHAEHNELGRAGDDSWSSFTFGHRRVVTVWVRAGWQPETREPFHC